MDDTGVVEPAFSLQALRAAGIEPKGDFEFKSAGATLYRPQAVRLRYAGGRQTFPHVSAASLLEGRVSSQSLKDRIVLIGLTVEGLDRDEWFTPFSVDRGQKMSGVEIHANAIETFFAARQIIEVSNLAMFLTLVGFAFALWWLDRQFEGVAFYTTVVVLIPAVVTVSWLLLK